MKLNKILLGLALLLFSVNLSYAAVTELAYYDFNGNAIDQWGGFNGTVNGATQSAVVPTFNNTGDGGSNSYYFDGVNDDITTSLTSTNDKISVSMWVRQDDTNTKQLMGMGGSAFDISYQDNAADKFRTYVFDGATLKGFETTSTYTDISNWYHIVTTYDQTTVRFYVDGVEVDNLPATINMVDYTTMTMSADYGGARYKGYMDEVKIWVNDALTPTEVRNIYNYGTKDLPLTTPSIVTNLSTFYNLDNINVSLTTDSNINMSYNLDAAGYISVCNNCNSSSIVLSSLSDATHNITFKSVNANGQKEVNQTFTIDTTNPTITNNIPSTSETYNFNGSWFSCTDSNLLSCNVSIDGENEATGVNFSLTHNGNLSYNITAIDLAGNQLIESGNLFVNPKIYFAFNDSGTLVEDYTFGGRADVAGKVNYTVYNDGLVLGNNSLTFEKINFISQSFNFTFNTTTAENYTFNINPAVINVNIFDRVTEALITQNVSIELVGNVGDSTSTITGTSVLRAINGTAGDYQAIASTTGYGTESVYFTYTNLENITLNIYLLNSTDPNYGVVNVQVKDSLSQFIEGSIVETLEWKANLSSYVSIAQCQTGTTGICLMNIELNDKLYKFRATKDSNTKTTLSQFLTATDSTIPITLDTSVLTVQGDLDGIISNFTETITNATNTSLTRFEWTQKNGVVVTACITTYKDRGFSLSELNQNCTTATSGIIFVSNLINNTYPITIMATIDYSGITYPKASFTHESTSSISVSLEENNLDIFVPIIFFFIGIALGLIFGSVPAALASVVILQWVAIYIAPRMMTVQIAAIITLIAGLIAWGINKK